MPTRSSATAGSQISVGVYDEPALIVLGVAALLGLHPADTLVISFAPADQPPDLDVVLCDPFARAVDVEEYLDRVVQVTTARVIVYSWSLADNSRRRALAAGASAYVYKSASAADLGAAVEAVHRGEPVGRATRPVAEAEDPALSTRESEVLALICRGMSNLEIAAALFVSVNSVKTYIRHVYRKIGATRRAQAVAWGLARGY